MRGHLDWDSPAGRQLAQLNRSLAAAYRDWMAPLVDAGQIRPMSMLMLTAIVTGPAHAIARRWLAGHLELAAARLPRRARRRCLRGAERDARERATRASLASRRGRIRLELIADDGSVIADGETTTELIPAARKGFA